MQIYSSNTNAWKKGIGYITEHYLQKNLSNGRGGVRRRRKRRACMGLPLQRMYGHVENFLAINDWIQTQIDCFNSSYITILFWQISEEKVQSVPNKTSNVYHWLYIYLHNNLTFIHTSTCIFIYVYILPSNLRNKFSLKKKLLFNIWIFDMFSVHSWLVEMVLVDIHCFILKFSVWLVIQCNIPYLFWTSSSDSPDEYW